MRKVIYEAVDDEKEEKKHKLLLVYLCWGAT